MMVIWRFWLSLSAGMTPCLHRACKPQHIGMGVVEGSGRDSDHFGFAPVAEHALGCEVIEQRATTLMAADHAQRQWAAATLGLAGRDHVECVRQARLNGDGVFDPTNPLRFEAFEIRYLGRREAPNRAVIDLSRDDDVILRPQSYFRIPFPEDRLFIPSPFIPLFVSRGWRLEGWS